MVPLRADHYSIDSFLYIFNSLCSFHPYFNPVIRSVIQSVIRPVIRSAIWSMTPIVLPLCFDTLTNLGLDNSRRYGQPHSIILQHQPYHDTVQTSHSSFSLWVGWSQTACVRLRSGSFSFFLDGLVIGWCIVFTYSPISQDVKMCITYIIIVFLHFSEDTRKLKIY